MRLLRTPLSVISLGALARSSFGRPRSWQLADVGEGSRPDQVDEDDEFDDDKRYLRVDDESHDRCRDLADATRCSFDTVAVLCCLELGGGLCRRMSERAVYVAPGRAHWEQRNSLITVELCFEHGLAIGRLVSSFKKLQSYIKWSAEQAWTSK